MEILNQIISSAVKFVLLCEPTNCDFLCKFCSWNIPFDWITLFQACAGSMHHLFNQWTVTPAPILDQKNFFLRISTFFSVASPKKERKENLIDFSPQFLSREKKKKLFSLNVNLKRVSKWLISSQISRVRVRGCGKLLLSNHYLVPYGKIIVGEKRVGGAKWLELFIALIHFFLLLLWRNSIWIETLTIIYLAHGFILR